MNVIRKVSRSKMLKEMPLMRKALAVTSCPVETNILALIQRLLCWSPWELELELEEIKSMCSNPNDA